MSAQGTTAKLANGVVTRDDPAPSTSMAAEVTAASEVQGTSDILSVHQPAAGPVVEAQGDVQGVQTVQPFQALETAAGVRQAKPKEASTIAEPGSRSDQIWSNVLVTAEPRLLEALGVSVKLELWGLLRALYGLREAPLLWGNFRDDTLRTLKTPRGLVWKQGKAITSWWSILDGNGHVTALVVVYVDDFMICGPREIVEELGSAVQQVWETSELAFLGPDNSIRFLGMELQRESENAREILVLQQGYLQELMRTHDMKSTHLDKIPITKELSIVPEVPEPTNPDLIRAAQQITGEVLWVAQRTRPDLSFATCIMATLCTRCPTQTLSIGKKVLGYLQRTSGYGLVVCWQEVGLLMYSDASFAPQGCRSHGGWVVMFGGVPVSWRSRRQSMITLSTAEAELLALLEGAVAAKSTEAILADIGEKVHERTIATDSTSALSITTGSSSWRTRHLRIKAGWLQEQIDGGFFKVIHWPGEKQPADLLTKALSSARLEDLLQWWSIGERRVTVRRPSTAVKVSARSLLAAICCLLMVSVQAGGGEQRVHGSGLQVDGDMASLMMILLMILGVLLIYEVVKWSMAEICNEWIPGAGARRLRRLQKLQVATTAAIERELERIQETGSLARESSTGQQEDQREWWKETKLDNKAKSTEWYRRLATYSEVFYPDKTIDYQNPKSIDSCDVSFEFTNNMVFLFQVQRRTELDVLVDDLVN
ncbi:unnamed protein product [Symbiodinium sp. CCMP2456]|nr:unnamed protein product [Symbiodinium sp. CCMP2456]